MKRYVTERELKDVQLRLLSDVDTFCREKNIKYSLAYGTLLGAIRHKGYIPWDDDIDIMIPRDDYKRFIEEYKNEDNYVISIENNRDYIIPFAKVVDKHTVLKEYANEYLETGIYIDVFPLDNYPEEKLKQMSLNLKKKVLDYIYLAKVIKLSKKRSIVNNFLLMMVKICTIFLPLRLISKCISNLAKDNKHSGGKIAILAEPSLKFQTYPSILFNQYRDIEFESLKCRVIANWKEYLCITYGNYMQLPPVHLQKSHHVYEAWWIE